MLRSEQRLGNHGDDESHFLEVFVVVCVHAQLKFSSTAIREDRKFSLLVGVWQYL